MNREYYYFTNGEQRGPLSIDQLKMAGIKPDTLVWTEGMDDWEAAKDVEGLNSIFKSPPPLRGSKPPTKSDNSVPSSAIKSTTPKWVYALLAAGAIVVGTVVYNVSSSSSTGESSFFSDITSSSIESDAKKMARLMAEMIRGYGNEKILKEYSEFLQKMMEKYKDRKSEFEKLVTKEYVEKYEDELKSNLNSFVVLLPFYTYFRD